MINGANLFYAPQFGIDPGVNGGQGSEASRNQWLLGLVNSAPYVRSSCLCAFHLLTHSCTPALLRRARLLAQLASKQLARPPRDDLPHRVHLLRGVHLAGRDELVAASFRRALRARAGNWAEVDDGASVCGGVRAAGDSWCACDDVVRRLVTHQQGLV